MEGEGYSMEIPSRETFFFYLCIRHMGPGNDSCAVHFFYDSFFYIGLRGG